MRVEMLEQRCAFGRCIVPAKSGNWSRGIRRQKRGDGTESGVPAYGPLREWMNGRHSGLINQQWLVNPSIDRYADPSIRV